MNRNQVAGILALIILSAIAWSTLSSQAAEPTTAQPATAWEYKIVDFAPRWGSFPSRSEIEALGEDANDQVTDEPSTPAKDAENDATEQAKPPHWRDVYVKQVEKVMNELGSQGWELVAIPTGQAIFKRPKQNQ